MFVHKICRNEPHDIGRHRDRGQVKLLDAGLDGEGLNQLRLGHVAEIEEDLSQPPGTGLLFREGQLEDGLIDIGTLTEQLSQFFSASADHKSNLGVPFRHQCVDLPLLLGYTYVPLRP